MGTLPVLESSCHVLAAHKHGSLPNMLSEPPRCCSRYCHRCRPGCRHPAPPPGRQPRAAAPPQRKCRAQWAAPPCLAAAGAAPVPLQAPSSAPVQGGSRGRRQRVIAKWGCTGMAGSGERAACKMQAVVPPWEAAGREQPRGCDCGRQLGGWHMGMQADGGIAVCHIHGRM